MGARHGVGSVYLARVDLRHPDLRITPGRVWNKLGHAQYGARVVNTPSGVGNSRLANLRQANPFLVFLWERQFADALLVEQRLARILQAFVVPFAASGRDSEHYIWPADVEVRVLEFLMGESTVEDFERGWGAA